MSVGASCRIGPAPISPRCERYERSGESGRYPLPKAGLLVLVFIARPSSPEWRAWHGALGRGAPPFDPGVSDSTGFTGLPIDDSAQSAATRGTGNGTMAAGSCIAASADRRRLNRSSRRPRSFVDLPSEWVEARRAAVLLGGQVTGTFD